MLQRLIDLRDRAEQKLAEETGGSRLTFPIYAFLLYSGTSLKIPSALEDKAVRRTIEAITGNHILLFIIEPLKYREEFLGSGSSMLIRTEFPVNAPAQVFKTLTGSSSEKLPALLFTKRLPQTSQGNNIISSIQKESVIVVSLEAETKDHFLSQMEEILSVINKTTSSLEIKEQMDPKIYFQALQCQLRKYKYVRLVRKSLNFLRELLNLLGDMTPA